MQESSPNPINLELEKRLEARRESSRRIQEALDKLPKCPFMEAIKGYKEFHRYYSGYYPFRSSDF